MGKTLLIFLFLCLLISYPTSFSVYAQSGSTTANVVGTVKDPQGATVAGTIVTFKQVETNIIRNFQTSTDGKFQFIQVPPGRYELEATADGYSPFKSKVTLTIGLTLLADIDLSLTATNEVIEVNASNIFSEVKTESSNTNNQDRIQNLPINRRDFLDFSITSPRVIPDRVPSQGVLSSSGLSFNGQSGRFNNITIDGLDNNDSNQGAVRATFSQDAVQEFQVVSDGYSAEFGRALAGIVNIVTKGGSNSFHGNLFFINRNDMISARNSFESTKTPFSQDQFGATFGGPIKRDRAFFFSSFERRSVKQNNIVTLSDQTVAAARNLGYPANNGSQPFSIGTTAFLLRSDIHLNQKDDLWVRYNSSFTYNGAYEPFGGLTDGTSRGIFNVDDNSLALNNRYISTALNLVNETRFLYSRRNQDTLPISSSAGVQLLAPEGTVSFGHTAFLPEFNSQRIYQIVNNSSLTKGIHQIKFGFDFTHVNRPPQNDGGLLPDGFAAFSTLDFGALFGFPGLPVLSGLQAFDPSLRTPDQIAFLTGISPSLPGFPANLNIATLPIPLIYLQGFGNSVIEVNAKNFSAFAQDDIRLKENFILKLGLRYDINRVDFTPTNNGNFSPRIGLSYQPKKLPNTRLHAAYGLFFAVPFIRSAISSQSSNLGLRLLSVTFPLATIPFSLPGHKIPSVDQLPPGIDFVPQLNLSTQYQPDLKSSYSQQINFGIDYVINSKTGLSANYNYLRGIRLSSLRNTNPVVRPVPNNPIAGMLFGRIDPTRGDLLEFESAFDSYYHALTISFDRRLANRINFFANYTFSKAIDNVIDFNANVTDRQNNPLTPGAERSLSLQDTRNRFIFSGTWDLSYTKNIFLRDYEASSIISINSGRPYNLLAGVDLNQNGDGGLSDRPTGLGRNAGIAPAFASVDLRLTRRITFKDSYKIEGFVEVFNLFNRVNINSNFIDRTFPPDAQGNFNLPPQEKGRYIVTPDRYRGAFDPRQFQFGLRLAF